MSTQQKTGILQSYKTISLIELHSCRNADVLMECTHKDVEFKLASELVKILFDNRKYVVKCHMESGHDPITDSMMFRGVANISLSDPMDCEMDEIAEVPANMIFSGMIVEMNRWDNDTQIFKRFRLEGNHLRRIE